MDALDAARHLAEHGVPIFIAKPDQGGGHNNTGYKFPKGWQKTEPDPDVVDMWSEGDALCAVMGYGVDAVDLDPHKGGELDGVEFPRSYGRQRTPSGGTHDLIAGLDVESKDGVQPGVDVKAGHGGKGHGFIFIAPTVKQSKIDGEWYEYVWEEEPNLSLLLIGGDNSGDELREAITTGRRRTSEGFEYDGPSYDELPDNLKLQAEEYVNDIVYDWKVRLGAAQAWAEGERDSQGRGWEGLARDAAWALASLAACPWTGLSEEEATEIYGEILPDVMAKNKKCAYKWYEGLVEKAAAEPVRQPPWWAQTFFEQTEILRHIRQAAHSRGVSSLSVLASVLGRVLLTISPSVTLPPVVGSRASLNLGFALVGDSGTTKSSSDAVAEELLGEVPEDWVLPIGSGEGMIDAYLEAELDIDEETGKVKSTGRQVPVSDPHRMFMIDEGETLGKLMDRAGATGGGLMRTALTGGTLGTTNARAGGRNRKVPKGSYRMIVVVDVHPDQSDVLLQGSGVGMPQRFLWMPARDKELPEQVEDMPDWPGELRWEPPEQDMGDVEYPDHIKREIRQIRLDANHKKVSAREAHANLTRLKIAYALAILHGDTTITDLWWNLAGKLSEASLRLQEACSERLQEILQARVTTRVVAEQRAVEAASEDRLERAVNAVLEKIKKSPGKDFMWREAKPAHRLTEGLSTEEILEELSQKTNVIVTEYVGKNKRTAWKVRYGARKEPKK